MTKHKFLAISGTSGVGKTTLEEKLQNTGYFYQLPKYTNRPLRPGEEFSNKIFSISTGELNKLKQAGKFIFGLEYKGYNYAWKQPDKSISSNKIFTIAITLDSLNSIIKAIPDIEIVILKLNINNLDLIKNRMLTRAGKDNINQKILEEIQQRLDLAKLEIMNFVKYEIISNLIFEIIDDNSLDQIIIPQILKLYNLPNTVVS